MIEIRELEKSDSKVWCHICKAKEEQQPLYQAIGFRAYDGWTVICKTCAEDLGLLGRPMSPKEYQEAAGRTECDQEKSRSRMGGQAGTDGQWLDKEGWDNLLPIRLNHACIGITKEGGELLSLMEKWIYYGQKFDLQKFSDELGDVLWYTALACNALKVDMGEAIMAANVRKLKARYPDKYSDERAANRDRDAEDAAVKDALSKCCECGEDYSRSDLLRGEIYCTKCRELDRVQNKPSDRKTLIPPRTRADVLRARGTVYGCCTRHADNQSCDCLETALVGSDVMSSIIPEPKCRHCGGYKTVTDEWSSVPTPCPICGGSDIIDTSRAE
jgi:NTP pyrophosphatase (non-canonical NTP hydrolase)